SRLARKEPRGRDSQIAESRPQARSRPPISEPRPQQAQIVSCKPWRLKRRPLWCTNRHPLFVCRLSCTDFTPPTLVAISFARSLSGADGTVPDSVTTASFVSTLMSVDLRLGSAISAVFTCTVIEASSTAPDILFDVVGEGVVGAIAVCGGRFELLL